VFVGPDHDTELQSSLFVIFLHFLPLLLIITSRDRDCLERAVGMLVVRNRAHLSLIGI